MKREFIKLSNDIWFYISFLRIFVFIKENPEYGAKPLVHPYAPPSPAEKKTFLKEFFFC